MLLSASASGVTWNLDETGKLDIQGSGTIEDSKFKGNNNIISVIIEDGITSIGNNASAMILRKKGFSRGSEYRNVHTVRM